MNRLQELAERLPPELEEEVVRYLESLINKGRPAHQQQHLSLDWRGGLRDLRDQFTSVELQHSITRLWNEDVPSRH